ncbi:DNA polymerase III subunit delta' [Lacibacterium aquatile]|uniref:DNA polymerase III subunit delta n=1 Tax=Lacibacterium aquatile TaxID=1168082 RepID=A0ABW5DNF7_9PROT
MSQAAEAPVPTPQTSSFLVGHAAAEAAFLESWNSGHCPHALLISGPTGIGKATLAYRIARFILAEGNGDSGGMFFAAKPDSIQLSEDHPVFRQVAAGSHPDLMVVERLRDEKTSKLKTNIAVDQVRAVSAFLHLTSSSGGWRVVLIDSVDDMNPNSANALLKGLEEPPARTMMLLVSHAPGRLLPTIRSRCRKLLLEPLDTAGMGQVMSRLGVASDASTLARLSAMAEGSPGRGLELMAGGGLELYAEIMQLVGAPDAQRHHAFADRLSRAGQETGFELSRSLLDWWLSRLVREAARGGAGPELVEGENRARARVMAAHSLDRLIEVWDKIHLLFETAMRLNLDKKQVLLSSLELLAPPGR